MALDPNRPVGERIIALHNCINGFWVLTYCKYNTVKDVLIQNCGLSENGNNTSETINECVSFLENKRNVFLKRRNEFIEKRKIEKFNGKRTPSKKDFSEYYDQSFLFE